MPSVFAFRLTFIRLWSFDSALNCSWRRSNWRIFEASRLLWINLFSSVFQDFLLDKSWDDQLCKNIFKDKSILNFSQQNNFSSLISKLDRRSEPPKTFACSSFKKDNTQFHCKASYHVIVSSISIIIINFRWKPSLPSLFFHYFSLFIRSLFGKLTKLWPK